MITVIRVQSAVPDENARKLRNEYVTKYGFCSFLCMKSSFCFRGCRGAMVQCLIEHAVVVGLIFNCGNLEGNFHFPYSSPHRAMS